MVPYAATRRVECMVAPVLNTNLDRVVFVQFSGNVDDAICSYILLQVHSYVTS